MKEYKTGILAAVDYIAVRDRTENEVRERLLKLNFSKKEIDETIEELYSSLLLNDQEYATEFVRSKLAVKPMSKRNMVRKLKEHKLSDENIELAMSGFDDDLEYENACLEARNFILRYLLDEKDAMAYKKKREKLFRRLLSHGYCYEVSKRAVSESERELKLDNEY